MLGLCIKSWKGEKMVSVITGNKKVFFVPHLFWEQWGLQCLLWQVLTILKAPYFSKIDIFIQERFNKLIYSINTITKYGIWQPVKFQLVSFFEPDQKWNDFL